MSEKLVSTLSSILIRKFKKGLNGYYSKVKYSTAQKDHYDALGISVNATQNEIKSAFYKLSLQYHPDKDASVGAKERFQEISRAYEVLSNYDLRRQYDMRMRATEGLDTKKKKPRSNVKSQFIVKPPKSGKIYDFDEWTRQHYGVAFQKQKEFEQKFHINQKTRKELNNPKGFSIPQAVLIISFFLCLFFVEISSKLVNMMDNDKHTSKSKSST